MEVNPANNVELTRVSLDDVDLFSEWEIGLGWDIDSTQLTAGTNSIGFNHFALPELLVGHFTSMRSMQNYFAVPDGMVIFLICRAKLPVFWNGRHFPPSMMGVVRSTLEHWVVIPEGWDCYEFMVTEDFVRRTEIFPENFYAQTRMLEHAHLPLLEPVTSQFLWQMDSYFLHQQGTASSLRRVVHGKQFLDFIIRGLLEVVNAGLEAKGSLKLRTTRRPDIVKKAMDFVASHLDDSLSSDDVAQALGVSNRVLDYAFRDSLGTSPYRYILTERLHAVRRLLKSSDVSVTEACVAHGFNTPSRFTRHYTRLFGELPSATRYATRSGAT